MRWRVLAGGLAQPALLAAGLALTVLPAFSSAFGGALPCDVPDELMQVDDKLPHLAERLRAEQPVRIVAIGGASTTGLAALRLRQMKAIPAIPEIQAVARIVSSPNQSQRGPSSRVYSRQPRNTASSAMPR